MTDETRDLAAIREDIDALDGRLLALIVERMALSDEVAACKAARRLPVRDPAREEEILARVAAVCPDAVPVYRALLEASRARQTRKLEEK